MSAAAPEVFCVGHEMLWPQWFHDAVQARLIIARTGGWRFPVMSADVKVGNHYVRVRAGDFIHYQDGRLAVIRGNPV